MASRRARIVIALTLAAPDGCDQPLAPTATVTTVANFGLRGTSDSSGLGRVTMSAPTRSYVVRTCLTPGTGERCAGLVQKVTVKIGLRLIARIDLGAGGGRWSYPG